MIPGGAASRPPEAYAEVRSISGSAAAGRELYKGSLQNHSIYPTPAGWKNPLSFARHPHRVDYPEAVQMAIGGAKVFFLPDPELPLIDMTIYVKAGAVDLQDSEEGLTDLLDGTIIRGGTKSRSPVELAMLLDDNAIKMGVDIGLEETAIKLSVMSSDWEQGLGILREVLTQPRFDAKVLEVAKEQALANLGRQGEDAQAVAIRESMIWHFKGHPYGRNRWRRPRSFRPSPAMTCGASSPPILFPPTWWWRFQGIFTSARSRRAWAVSSAVCPREQRPSGASPTRLPLRRSVTLIPPDPGGCRSSVVARCSGVPRVGPRFLENELTDRVFPVGSDSLIYTRLRDDLGYATPRGSIERPKSARPPSSGSFGCNSKRDRGRRRIRRAVNTTSSLCTRAFPAASSNSNASTRATASRSTSTPEGGAGPGLQPLRHA